MGPLLLLIVLGGVAYGLRIAPRVMAQMQRHPSTAAATGSAFASSSSHRALYRQYEHPFQTTMTHAEARLIFGFDEPRSGSLVPEPSVKEIQDRYRALMALHHTDVGGSPVIAQKVNEARAMLILEKP